MAAAGGDWMDRTKDSLIPKDAIDWKQKARDLGDRVHRLHRSVLDKDLLRGLLPVRARTLPHRSSRPDARERERRLIEASRAYAGALEDATPWGGQTRAVTLDGLTWWVPLTRPGDPVHVERSLRHQDFPYRALTQTRDLGIGGGMIDIGGNVGRMSIPRVILGDVAYAYCAEPDPLNYTCLVRNVRDNHLRGLVLPDRVALGSVDGTVRLERARSAGGHRVVDPGARTRLETIEVPSLRLDSWVARLGIDLQQVTFVKMDAQGSEVHILRGAPGVLAHRHIAWEIEVDPQLLRARGVALKELFILLQQHFTHFVDLNRTAAGERVRRTTDLPSALAYLSEGGEERTDVLVCTLAPVDR